MLNTVWERPRFLLARLIPLCVLLLAAASLFLLGYNYLADPGAFNSDNLLCSDLCGDLLHGRDVTGWHLPGAPYLFPDLPLLALCQLMAPNIVIEFLVYCLLFYMCLLAVLAWLGRLTGLGGRQALTAAGLGVTLLAVTHLGKPYTSRACLLVHPGNHIGALLAGLFLLALTVYSLQRGWTRPRIALFLVAGGLASFSDKLLLPQVLIPATLALAVLSWRRVFSRKQAAGQFALLAGVVLLSLGTKYALTRLGLHLLHVEDGFSQPRLSDLSLVLMRLYRVTEHQHLLCALIPLHLLLALLVLRFGSHPPGEGGACRGVLLAALTLVLSPLCLIATLVATGTASNPALDRYSLSCFLLPCLFLPLLLFWLPGRAARAGGLLGGLAVAGFAAVRIAALVPEVDRSKFEPPYPPLARALDRLARQRGPLRGLAGFWLARSINFFTREQVVINATEVMAEPYFHAANAARFLPEDSGDLSVPGCQFLLVRSGSDLPPPGLLALRYGQPAEKIPVGSDEIWWYGTRRSAFLDRFLRARLAERLRARRPYVGPIVPACLARPKPNRTPSDARGTVTVEPGQTLELRFAGPITGRLIDLGADNRDQLDLAFYRGEERLGGLHVPAVPMAGAAYEKAGIQARLLSVPGGLRRRAWDRVVVEGATADSSVHLGHFLVFAEDLPGPPALPSAFPAHVRLARKELWPSLSPEGGAFSGVNADAVVMSATVSLPPGRYRLDFAVKVADNTSAEEVARLRAVSFAPDVLLGERPLRGHDFRGAGRYETQSLTFEIATETPFAVFGLVTSGTTPVALDYIDLIAEPPDCSQ